NRPLSGTSTSTLDYTPESVNAQVAWQQWGLDGTGVGVAVIDSGITAVGDLYWWIPSNQTYGSRVVYSQNFVPGTTDTSDLYGHGTHVAGIIASQGWFSTGGNFTHTFKGIAPNANIINLRVLDQNGAGTDSSVIAAIQTAISLKSTYNIRVINLSLGRQVYESYTVDPLCQAVEAAWSAGIVVVACSLNCLTKRINRVALVDLAAKRKVDHSNVVRRFQADGRLDRRNYAAVGAGAVLV